MQTAAIRLVGSCLNDLRNSKQTQAIKTVNYEEVKRPSCEVNY